ncbi:MucR family transcriptional regulator [Pararhizobium sp. BT-229]|uniref:MucR family transcriptional regulator n=1 Tax=Pararhizobium sp. BT-229 TaxID=2986923 RepID=UPI0021F7EBC8|nr:MucR family transcriptional regulator [Pararhizobium sp. BT-229]MCV9965038.1 MucR family transcriptional regulator [Pararhizobium sp. BT-229]
MAGEIAQGLANKWGSARAALDRASVYGEKSGRKAKWLRVLEAMAAEEERAESSDGSISKSFSHIPRTPKVPVEQSVTDDFIVCLVDGAPRRHLSGYIHAKYGMSPDDYRRHFDLPKNYPMVARKSKRSPPTDPGDLSNPISISDYSSPFDIPKRTPAMDDEEARSWIVEWGSARAALRKAMVGRDGPGRKAGWLKRLEQLADEEQRKEIAKLPPISTHSPTSRASLRFRSRNPLPTNISSALWTEPGRRS